MEGKKCMKDFYISAEWNKGFRILVDVKSSSPSLVPPFEPKGTSFKVLYIRFKIDSDIYVDLRFLPFPLCR